MRICAHLTLAPWQNCHYRYDSIRDAVEAFRLAVEETREHYSDETLRDVAVMDIYPQCDACSDRECHHDYPLARYGLGARMGVRKLHT